MRALGLVWLMTVGCVQADGDTRTEDTDETGGTTDPGPTPLAIDGYSADVAIADGVGWSQAEPTAVALEDGTVLAAWMHIETTGGMWIRYSRSTDGGRTWSDPEKIDEDRWGYQNDPVLVQGGGYVYFTWLAVEGSSYDRMTVYCKDSTDGGVTWSDPVRITEADTMNDRQWMDVDDSGRVVMSWDHFTGNGYTESQQYAESPGGCDAFGEIEEVASGYFLNGVPAIDTNGDVWVTRQEIGGRSYDKLQVHLAKKTADGWDDEVVMEGDSAYLADPEAYGEEPEEELTEFAEELEAGLDEPEPGVAARLAPFLRRGPRAVPDGDFDGVYSPVTMALPDGGLAIATLLYEEGSTIADVHFATVRGGETTEQLLNQDEAGNPQVEPWLAVDPGGGLHASWFDARNGPWTLMGATSLDGGDTWAEYDISDDTFRKGFDDGDPSLWVGHFQALTATSTGVVAVWGDSSSGDASWIHADRAEP